MKRRAPEGFKFIGASDPSSHAAGAIVEGLECGNDGAASVEKVWINVSEDEDEPDWISVHPASLRMVRINVMLYDAPDFVAS
jgi:hypothetical protein